MIHHPLLMICIFKVTLCASTNLSITASLIAGLSLRTSWLNFQLIGRANQQVRGGQNWTFPQASSFKYYVIRFPQSFHFLNLNTHFYQLKKFKYPNIMGHHLQMVEQSGMSWLSRLPVGLTNQLRIEPATAKLRPRLILAIKDAIKLKLVIANKVTLRIHIMLCHYVRERSSITSAGFSTF